MADRSEDSSDSNWSELRGTTRGVT